MMAMLVQLNLLMYAVPVAALVAPSASDGRGPAVLRADSQAIGIDHELRLPHRLRPTAPDCLGGWNMMNPSLLESEGSILSVFRGLCIKPQGNGFYHWNSSLIIGKAPMGNIHADAGRWTWDNLQVYKDPRFSNLGSSWGECRLYDLKDISTGPEDPRLFKAHGKTYLSFNGFDIVHSEAKTDDERPQCGDRGKFVFVSEVSVDEGGIVSFKKPVPLIFPSMNSQEKNWGFFSPPAGGDEDTSLAVYQVDPHIIVRADLVKGRVTKIFSSSSDKVNALARSGGFNSSYFHGGGIATLIKPKPGAEYFLGVFHMHSTPNMDAGRIPYKNWPYKFSTKPPYEILDVGGQLPLVSAKNPAWGTLVQFVSSFMLDESGPEPFIVISYGSGDRMSRTLSMPFWKFEHTFFGPKRRMWQSEAELQIINFTN